MNKSNKKISTLIAIFLSIAMLTSSIFAILPIASAANQTLPMFMYADAAPNPTGVGQPLTIVCWTALMAIPTLDDPKLGAPGGRETFLGMKLDLTKPDGTKQTINLPPSDPVGNNYYSYVPDQVGTYSYQAFFTAQWKNITSWPAWGSAQGLAANTNYYLQAAESEVGYFNVTQEPLQYTSGVPFPTEYWTRPINARNREWSQIAGNWMTGLRDLPYISAPNSAHVVWTAPYGFGGISGGNYNGMTDISYHTGSAYEGKFANPQIINGWLFYNQALEDSVTTTHTQIIARDIRTGEIMWAVNGTSEAGSSIYNYDSRNQHGTHPYLWTSGTFKQALSPSVTPPANTVVDPFTGVEMFAYTDVPSGTWAVGENGERILYAFGGPSTNRTWLALWNSTAAVSMTNINSNQLAYYKQTGELLGSGFDQWRPVGKIINGTEAYSWNVTLPKGLATSYQVYTFDDMLISGYGFVQFGTSQMNNNFGVWAVSLKPETRGQLLWQKQITPPSTNVTMQWTSADRDAGILVLRAKETRQFIAYDITTGNQLWITDPQPAWMMYSSGSEIVNGKLYSGGYGGQVFAYDITNGDLVWTADVDTEGLESPYQRTPLTIQVVDGKVFARSQEHSHTQPLYRSWKIYAFNGTTGDRMWDLNGYWSAWAFSDGFGVGLNGMDNLIYCVGKGPTAITVQTGNDIVTNGNNVLLQGKVTDISAGTKSSALMIRFPDGVPAVSETSMTDWMQHVYSQMPRPTDVTGVTVSLDVIDANGNYRNVGIATSDSDGFYSFDWKPDIEGKYTVIAKFDGSESYWPSQAETAFVVNEAAPTPTAQPSLALPPTEMYVLGIGVAIIIAIAIATLLIIKKRP
jgi:hypothetical protein